MKVAVLGSGPAGMFAAHACVQHGVQPDIISNTTERSELRGAQYLHKEIPEITDPLPVADIQYVKIGTPGNYCQRVYGEYSREGLSWYEYDHGHVGGWNLRRAYYRAFTLYKSHILVRPLSHEDVEPLNEKYDLIINTVPLTVFATPHTYHGFDTQPVWIVSENFHYQLDNRNMIVYNGGDPNLPGTSKWYRYSQLFGWKAEEYGRKELAPHDAVRVLKPLSVEVSPVPATWLCVGRYGAWRKRALTHDAYYDVAAHLEANL